jgi:hypothetical protein
MFLLTKENATGVTRTVVTFLYAWAATNIPAIGDWLDTVGLDAASFTLVAGGVVYQLIRAGAERWGWLGYLLVFNTKPDYVQPTP